MALHPVARGALILPRHLHDRGKRASAVAAGALVRIRLGGRATRLSVVVGGGPLLEPLGGRSLVASRDEDRRAKRDRNEKGRSTADSEGLTGGHLVALCITPDAIAKRVRTGEQSDLVEAIRWR